MANNNEFKDLINKSLELEKSGKHASAMELLDEAIAEAVRIGDVRWISTLCHHAAVLSRFDGNSEPATRYYEQSLASNPENAVALYGLAAVALDQGDHAMARQYATRCHASIVRTDDKILKMGLLDLIAKNWPDLAEK